jgi:hypothetical protein
MDKKKVESILDVINKGLNFLFGKPTGKTTHERIRHAWNDDIKIDLEEREHEGIAWIHVTEDRDL